IGAATLPVWQRYTGVVWEHLDPGSLRAADRRRLLVFSGALGLVRGDDPIPDYRLKMGGRLAPLGTMSAWWQPHLTSILEHLTRRHLIVEMLANEQRAAYVAPSTGSGRTASTSGAATASGMTVTLLERDGKSGGHAAKAAKGLLARHLIEQGAATSLDE
ncbi:peroxide stress protein YaaA, partial [Arthrospira platensis SPKY2]